MDILQKIFPLSFGVKTVQDLVIKIIIYVVAAVAAGLVMWLAGLITGWIPVVGVVIGLLLRIVGLIVEIYVVAGIVFVVLDYAKVLK